MSKRKTSNKLLDVFGKQVEVVVLDSLKEYAAVGDPVGTEYLGTYSRDTQKIHLKAKQGRQVTESTLLHELLEAIVLELGIQLEHPDLCRLEAGVYAVLTQNKVSFAPLLKGVVL